MMIVNLSEAAILHISEAASRAGAGGQRLRLSFGQSGGINTVSYKVGEGAWSAPFYDQPDPYADPPRLSAQSMSMSTAQSVSLQRLGSKTAGTSD